ncbi:YveK family protein [Allochromatium vinosum]|uniref:Lipopolysaccharide biosynthesis protein n=1 Tax=Allochromatium vinosum (strain ATCC 17899 / DSM 180 / NBRC 103801 / NCIMB 10441 / D) TaxID=572477 RepID=D3RS01_ALLVD|nr:hypothetical protein [Allochromatium vinosum]ADC63938.1 hypothetical protein Alvin_3038 [Allochromatium vinosum DSM 180]
MSFYIKCYLSAFREHRHWTLIALVPVMLYLLVAAVRVDNFLITQDFTYSGEIRIAMSHRPVDTLTLDALLTDPDRLFLDTFALSQLQQRLEFQPQIHELPTSQGLKRLAHGSMHLSSRPDSRLRLTYTGSHVHIGETMVDFYSQLLVQRVEAGAARHSDTAAAPPSFKPVGPLTTTGVASLWSAERLPRAILVFVLSLLAVVLLIGILDLSDPSFKSERQIARYLDLPVLGSMPDARQLARHLEKTQD